MSEGSDKPDGPPVGGGTEVIAADVANEWGENSGLPIELPGGHDRYEVEGEIARGSMGIIKKVHDLALRRSVALKQLRPDCTVPGASTRFLDEARITAQLQHPGIVAVYEIGVGSDAMPYFTMQLVEGRTLGQLLTAVSAGEPEVLRRYPRVRLLNLFVQVCMAVAYAHNRGVIHRDLKPDNIMLGEFGEVFVMDWGLAKITTTEVAQPVVGGRPEDASFGTRVGDITGTPAYMSP
ncbi:MAG: serine/threonine protein kinase, partial [Myxococcales bacterium]|nr:serine/threonine protein kinase [Myxococcales bacterium]